MKKKIRLLVLSCVLFASPVAVNGDVIGLDNVHGYDADSMLLTGSNYDEFRAAITGLGHTIVPLNGFEAADLAGVDAAFLVNNYSQNFSPYSDSEMSAIQGFTGNRGVFVSDTSVFANQDRSDFPLSFGDNRRLLENIVSFITGGGSGVAFLAEDDTGFDIGNYNQMVAPFGISFADTPVDPTGHIVTDFVPHPLTAGLSQVGVDFQLPITTSGSALDLTTFSGSDNILAVTNIPEPGATMVVMVLTLTAASCRSAPPTATLIRSEPGFRTEKTEKN